MAKTLHTWSRPYLGITHYTSENYWGTVTNRGSFVEASTSPLDMGLYCGFEHCEEKLFPANAIGEAKAWVESWGDDPGNRETINRMIREREARRRGLRY